jgi:hypothetical protein
MAGSNASNLGYGNITPYNNINGNYVNVTSSNDPANFSNRIIPGNPPGFLHGLAGAKNNIDAASGCVTGACYKGGYKFNIKSKINNITNKYKMKSKKRSNLKRKLRSRTKTRTRTFTGGKRTRTHNTRKKRHTYNKWSGGFAHGFPAPNGVTNYPAGYGQYQNNLPTTPSYAVGGILSGNNELGLANPPPITHLNNSNVDNYNHFNNQSYSSRGH